MTSRLTLADVARHPRPGTVVPGRVAFTPDGAAVTYLWSTDGTLVRSLWRYDVETGEARVIAGPEAGTLDEGALSREEELRRERGRLRELGVTDYSFARDARPLVLLVPSPAGAAVAVGDGPLRHVRGTEGAEEPHLSPDGRRLAFVRDGDLYALELPDGEPRRLTHDAEDGLTNGLAEFIAQEELDRDHGLWWSPDGQRIAFVRSDARRIPRYPIVHQGLDRPEVEEHRYPFAGERNALLRLGVVPAIEGGVQWLDLGPGDDRYIARVAWRPDGVLAAQLLARDQRSATWLTWHGAETARTLISDTGDPWLNLDDDMRFLESGEIVRTSEASGFRHLELRAADGSLTQVLTSGDWAVTGLVAVDDAARRLLFMGTREGPRERHLYAVSLGGGEPERLTTGSGWHDVTASPDATHLVDTWSDLRRPPRVRLLRGDGSCKGTIHEDASVTADTLGLSPPEPIELTADDGTTLLAALYRPAAPGRLPLIVACYGLPHVQTVTDQWALTVDMRAQYLTQRGFAVLKLDNRGSDGRGVAFEAHIAGRMGTVEVEDQAAGVREMVARGIADPERVGIYGWSGGGFLTLMCLLRAPDIFRAGVAGAPVTAWDGYDTAYTERYMGTPEENPAGYREGSPLHRAADLRGPLLLIHGLVDENVHFRHTARLMVALGRAQKPYESVLFPEERHMPRHPRDLEYLERRLTEHFERHLLRDPVSAGNQPGGGSDDPAAVARMR